MIIPSKQVSSVIASPNCVLGPETVGYLGDVPVALNKDLRKCVAFVGDMTPRDDGAEEFSAGGAAFFVGYDGVCYLVTARHVAEALPPLFSLRATNNKNEDVLLNGCDAKWFYHPDPNVDVAIVVGIPKDVPAIPPELIMNEEKIREKNICLGDEAYIIGLYRLLKQEKKNVPVVHSGNISLMPGEARIPQRDRTNNKLIHVDGFLIEAQTLEGLSGSPVFARHAWAWRQGDETAFMFSDPYLIGLWSGAWDAPPGSVLSLERPEAKRVPVGMGIAVSSQRLFELLEHDEVVAHRIRRKAEEMEISQDYLALRQLVERVKDENFQHKEDFSRLLGAAVKKPQQGEET